MAIAGRVSALDEKTLCTQDGFASPQLLGLLVHADLISPMGYKNLGWFWFVLILHC